MEDGDTGDRTRLRVALVAERGHVADRIDALQRNLAGIVDAAQLASTDDEHDPEGVTIAYERAQVTALLRLAQDDLVALDHALERVNDGTIQTCEVCGGVISIDRLLALPGVRTCIRCAS